MLRKSALTNEGGLVYTDKLRWDLLNSLEERFKDCDENETFLLSTFLDPNFGISAFSDEKKLILKSKLITYLKLEALKQQVKNVQLYNNNQLGSSGSILAESGTETICTRSL